MPSDLLTATELRTLVISTLDHNPDASFGIVHSHLRARQGRTLESAETEQLREAYELELAHPTGAHRVGTQEAAETAMQQPFALRRTEIAGLAAGLLPLLVHLQTTGAATTNRTTGVVTAGGVYDLAAMVGGFLAVILGACAALQVTRSAHRRAWHAALACGILLLGLYQILLGFGVLHRIGLYSAS